MLEHCDVFSYFSILFYLYFIRQLNQESTNELNSNILSFSIPVNFTEETMQQVGFRRPSALVLKGKIPLFILLEGLSDQMNE